MLTHEETLAKISQIAQQVRHLRDLLDRGYSSRELELKARAAELVRLRKGWYVPATFWRTLHAEDQQLALVHAIGSSASAAPVFSHISAAALHGLPLHDKMDATAHVITPPGNAGNASRSLKRHRVQLDHSEVMRVGPYLCTTPERTILDLALTAPTPWVLSIADAYLRHNFRVERHIDETSVADWRDRLRESADQRSGQRGVRTARWIAANADPRADSPLESMSRYHLDRLGFRVSIQVPVPARYGGYYYLDFDFEGLNVFGECDGKYKYTDPALPCSVASLLLSGCTQTSGAPIGSRQPSRNVLSTGDGPMSTPRGDLVCNCGPLECRYRQRGCCYLGRCDPACSKIALACKPDAARPRMDRKPSNV